MAYVMIEVDDEDADLLERIAAIHSGKVSLARLIMLRQGGIPEGMEIDHINRNPLDNRRANLRIVTREQNNANTRPHRGSVSRYKGVYRNVSTRNGKQTHHKKNPWVAKIQVGDKSTYLGVFPTEIEAAKAYDKAAFELHGEYAYLNFPEDYGLPPHKE